MYDISTIATVLGNVPLVCAKQLLLPADVQIVPTLRQSYPSLYRESHHEEEEVYYEGWNMSSVSRASGSCTGEPMYVGWDG